MKKLTVGFAVLLSGLATNSLAAPPNGNFSSSELSVPSYYGRFTLGFTGLYWRSSAQYLDYALTFPEIAPAGPAIFSRGDFRNVDHDYNRGAELSVGYVFGCSANDLTFNYRHWNSDNFDQKRIFAGALPTTIAPFFTLGGFPVIFEPEEAIIVTAPFVVINGGVPLNIPSFTIDTVLPAFDFLFGPSDLVSINGHSSFDNVTWELDFGQAINVGCRLRLHWFGGVRYSKLEHNFDTTAEFQAADSVIGTPILGATVQRGTVVTPNAVDIVPVFDIVGKLFDFSLQKSNFTGVGPQVGFDATYHLGRGFGVVGKLSTALFVGETESTYIERIEVSATAVLNTADTIITPTAAFPFTTPAGTTIPVAGVLADAITPIISEQAFSYRHPDETRVVPNIDAKLGLNWTYQFCNCLRTMVTAELGYMVSHYFNAVDRLSGLEMFVPEARSRQVLDVSFDGPYVAVQVNI